MAATHSRRFLFFRTVTLGLLVFAAKCAAAQTPSPALLVLEKSDDSLAIVDPTSLKILGRVPVGQDPHEIITSPDGKVAYVSNYGGNDSSLNTIGVVDLVARKPLPPINLGALRSPHGLAFAGGKLYFTVETNKAFGRYDPATQKIDWVLGTGQDRTHMIEVSERFELIFTANVNSGTISIIEQVMPPFPPQAAPPGGGPPPGAGPGPGAPRKTWKIENVPSGRGCEGFDVSPDGKEVWAANALDGTITIIDVASRKAIQTLPIAVNHANRLKFTPDGQRVLVSGLGAGTASSNLEVLDVATRKEIKQLKLGGGSAGILIVPDGSRAFVAVSERNKVAVVDLKSLEVTGEIQTGKQPDGLAWVR
jgi:YVTN family beta-propeller protein